MITPVLHWNRFFLLLLISVCTSNRTSLVKTTQNTEFENKRITEVPMITRKVGSILECVAECKMSPSCLSVSFNDESKNCCMYDQDFVYVTETQTINETGWDYYYIVAGNIINKSACELPTIGICRSFCFFYRNGFSYHTVHDFVQACSVRGGEVVKVDRYLKQYCMAQAVDHVIGDDLIALNGIQNETTGKWTHFDGTEMTYFYWDDKYGEQQPDYVSAIATPGLYTGSLVTHRSHGYRWHDYFDKYVDGVFCEIK